MHDSAGELPSWATWALYDPELGISNAHKRASRKGDRHTYETGFRKRGKVGQFVSEAERIPHTPNEALWGWRE